MTHTQPTYCTMHSKVCQIKKSRNPKIQNYVGLSFKTTKTFKKYLRDVFQNITFFLSKGNILFIPFLNKCSATTKSIHEVLSHHCTLSEGTPCFSGKYQHLYFYTFNTTLTCVPAIWRFVIWERSSRSSSPLSTSCKSCRREKQGNLPMSLVFLCVKYEQPLENRNKTSTDSSKGKNRNTRELCTGKSILFQDLNAMLLQEKTGAKKTQPTWQEQREAEPKHSSILSCSISPFREMHTCTIKTSTFHQKTKCCTHTQHYVHPLTKATFLH